jgi:hypothetical protein
LLASRREDIEAGLLRVLLLDECHLLWGDSIGYVWGRTDQEISIPISQLVLVTNKINKLIMEQLTI